MIYSRNFSEARALLEHLLSRNVLPARVYKTLGKLENEALNPPGAQKFLKESLRLDPGDGEAHFQLAKAYMKQRLYEKALKHLGTSIDLGGFGEEDITLAYLSAARLHEERGETKACLNVLKTGLERRPWDTALRHQLIVYEAGRDAVFQEEVFRDLLRYDLTLIIDAARRRGVRLILQNYPSRHGPESDEIREIAARFDVPFVDNERAFDRLRREGTYEQFIVADGHCNKAGYGLMAENVYAVLRQHGFVPDR